MCVNSILKIFGTIFSRHIPLVDRQLWRRAAIPPNSCSVCCFARARIGYNKSQFARPMDYVIRPLTPQDEPILWEMLYHGLSDPVACKPASRDMLRQPETSKYVAGWGRPADRGFVAHEKRGGALIGAVWLRQSTDKSGAVPELALAVKQEHRRHGIGTALLTQLVRANPDQSTISISFVAGKPVLRLYERFGFKVIDRQRDAVVMQRQT
jgi:GNAT superfamily N-acetyltransferase